MKLDDIEAILFDPGRVLNFPQMGHWFIPPNFFNYVDKLSFERISIKRRHHAFESAGSYINSIPFIKTREEEYEHFEKFYDIFSKELPELQLNKNNVCNLAKALVNNPLKYTFFDDAIRVIPLLEKKYKLAVVSDAWPSLREVFKNTNLYSSFSSFVISSEIGVTKPNKKMYLTALEYLGVTPEKALFIDDNITNCLGAKKLGIKAVLLCRNKRYYILEKIKSIGKGYGVITSLDELR